MAAHYRRWAAKAIENDSQLVSWRSALFQGIGAGHDVAHAGLIDADSLVDVSLRNPGRLQCLEDKLYDHGANPRGPVEPLVSQLHRQYGKI